MDHLLTAPLTPEMLAPLRAGDRCLLSGRIYCARDAAHARIAQLIQAHTPLPVDLKNQVIYFMGPSPAAPGQVIGAAGPTTAGRMDAYSPLLISCGLTGMIGKGRRNKNVIDAMKQYKAVYFGAVGGCGALFSRCILSSRILCYEDLGTEALRELVVKDMPLTVVIDSEGNDLYELGPEAFRTSLIPNEFCVK